jgi:hypothetical protein
MGDAMTVESENNEPNEFAFSGGATAPQPRPDREPGENTVGEDVAVPGGDITGAVTAAIEDATERDDSSAR